MRGKCERKSEERTPFHRLRIVEKALDDRPAEEVGVVVTHIYLDDKELHGLCENELRITYGPGNLAVAYIPVPVASVTIEREHILGEDEGPTQSGA